MNQPRTVHQETLDEIVRRIVEVAERGRSSCSARRARGEMGPTDDDHAEAVRFAETVVGWVEERL